MEKITIKNFKGVAQRVSQLDLQESYAEICKDFVMDFDGLLKKRTGYSAAKLNDVTFVTTGIDADYNIVRIFELLTERETTTAPNEAIKYIAQAFKTAVGGRLYVWNELTPTWTRIDNDLSTISADECNIIALNGIARIMTGNGSANEVLWYGYINDNFQNALSGTDGTLSPVAGAFSTNALLAKLTKPVCSAYLSVTPVYNTNYTTFITMVVNATYWYKISLQYDGLEWSLPSDDYIEVKQLYGSRIETRARLDIVIPQVSISKRITGIRIYRTGSEDRNFYFIKQIGFNLEKEQFQIKDESCAYNNGTGACVFVGLAGSEVPVIDAFTNMILHIHSNEGDFYVPVVSCTPVDTITVQSGLGVLTGVTGTLYIGWYDDATNYDYSFQDYEAEVTDNTNMYLHLGYAEDMEIDCQYADAVVINDRVFAINLYYDKQTRTTHLRYCLQNPDGWYSYDCFIPSNVISFPSELKKVVAIKDRLFIFGLNSIHRGAIPTANIGGWHFEKSYTQFGLLADKSLIVIDDNRFIFLSSDINIKISDGNEFMDIGDAVYSDLITAYIADDDYVKNAQAEYDSINSRYMIKFQYSASTYKYWLFDLKTESWYLFNYHFTNSATEINFLGFLRTVDGRTLAYIANNIYKLNSGNQDYDVDINPLYKTKPLSIGVDYYNILLASTIRYKSDTEVIFDIYLDEAATSESFTKELDIQTIINDFDVNIPFGSNCETFQIELKIKASEVDTNTYFDIDEIIMMLKLLTKRVGARGTAGEGVDPITGGDTFPADPASATGLECTAIANVAEP